MNRLNRQKPSSEIRELADIMNQMDLTDIYRTFHSNRKKYTFFSVSHRILSKIDHIFGNKANIHRYRNWSNHMNVIASQWGKDRIQSQYYTLY